MATHHFLSKMAHQLRQLYSNLMPIPCLLCGTHSVDTVICIDCLHQLPYSPNACPRCAMPLSHNALCGTCLNQPVSQDLSFSPFIYQAPLTRLISQFKYQNQLSLTEFFADKMIHHRGTNELPQALIPVPLHPKRLRQRGYNQSHELAKVLSNQLDIVIQHPIARTHATQPQAGLSFKQRKQNVKNAFQLVEPKVPNHVALIDDVLTSGQTANAITHLLRKSGVKTIELWTIARTIRHD